MLEVALLLDPALTRADIPIAKKKGGREILWGGDGHSKLEGKSKPSQNAGGVSPEQQRRYRGKLMKKNTNQH